MKLDLHAGSLIISDVGEEDRGRLMRIDQAILHAVGVIRNAPFVDRGTSLYFKPELTRTVASVLNGFTGLDLSVRCAQCTDEAEFDSPDLLCSEHWIQWWIADLELSPDEAETLIGDLRALTSEEK